MQVNRSNAGALIAGTILILFGLMALTGQVCWFINWGAIWPFIVIGFGALFFVAMAAGGKQAAPFAIPASILSGVGLVLLIQNITGHWETMSYFWTLIILFVGFGIYMMGRQSEDEKQKQSGWNVMRVGFILFLIFGAFFEMIFSSFGNVLFPILLIVLGAYLVLSRSGMLGSRKVNELPKDSIPPAS